MTNTPHREGYYILSLKNGPAGDALLWWRPNNAGYTITLEAAGVYTQAEVDAHPRYYNDGENTVAVPVAEAEARAFRVVGIDDQQAMVASRYRAADTQSASAGD